MATRIIVDVSTGKVTVVPFTPAEEAALRAAQAIAAAAEEVNRAAREKAKQISALRKKADLALLDEEAKSPDARQEIKDWDVARKA